MATYEYDSSYFPAAPVFDIRIGPPGGTTTADLRVFLDTGADATIVPLSLLRQLRAPKMDRVVMRSAWGEPKPSDLYAVTVQVEDLVIAAAWVVGDELEAEPVLGRDLLGRLRVLLDGPAGVFEIAK